jgi:hypothetical protein
MGGDGRGMFGGETEYRPMRAGFFQVLLHVSFVLFLLLFCYVPPVYVLYMRASGHTLLSLPTIPSDP